MSAKNQQKRLSHDLFKENMVKLMNNKKFSDAELGRHIGVSRVTIWRWRSGKQEPLGADRDALADALGVSVCRLYKAS